MEMLVGSEPIDLGLSPTGDPKEAYQRQEQDKMYLVNP